MSSGDWIVVLGLLAFPTIYIVVTYNRLVVLRQLVANAWSNIDTELKRRHDLIPRLVEVVQGYAAHERDVLDRVAQARARVAGDPHHPLEPENELARSVRGLLALVEGYPQLRSDRHFLNLQQELVRTEDRIQSARRFYNGNVKDLNTLVEQFPSRLIASLGRFQPADYYELESIFERGSPSIQFPG